MEYQFLLTGPCTPTWSPPTTVTITATSTSAGFGAENICNNAGMTGARYPQDTHNLKGEAMWLSDDNDAMPTVTIDLGAVYPLGKMLIWNFNQFANGVAYSGRGIRHCQIRYSADKTIWANLDSGGSGGQFELAQAPTTGAPTAATNQIDGPNAPVDFRGAPARYVQIQAQSNWGGALNDGKAKCCGLSQVRIYRYASRVKKQGDLIAARALKSSSTDSPAENTVNNLGMSDAGSGDYTCSATVGIATGWLTGPDDPAPHIVYDLGGTYPIGGMHVWNYNVSTDGSVSGRGIKNARIFYSVINKEFNPDKAFSDWTLLVGPNPDKTWILAKTSGTGPSPATNDINGNPIPFSNALARYIMIVPNTGANDGNWGGAAADGKSIYYGLSQVRFAAGRGLVVEPLPQWNGIFGQRTQAPDPPAWSGGDNCGSVGYVGKDGRPESLFAFLDALTQNWDPKTYSRVGGWRMTASNIAIYKGGKTLAPSISDITFLTTTTLVPDPDQPAKKAWPVAGIFLAKPSPTLYLIASEIDYSEAPKQTQTALTLWGLPVIDGVVQFEGPNISQSRIDAFKNEPIEDSIYYGQEILDGSEFGDPYLYVFGIRTDPRQISSGAAVVARVKPENIREIKSWEFYAGAFGWVGATQNCDFTSSYPISSPPGRGGRVVPAIDPEHKGQFMMISVQDMIGPVAISYAPNPWGPFDTWQQLYDKYEAPYSGAAYALNVHPDLSDPDEVIFTCIPFMWAPSEKNADVSHARFVRMRYIQ